MKKSNEMSQSELAVELNLKVDDPALDRKRQISSPVQWFESQPLPSIIEISESGTCNRACSFCPRSAPEFLDKKEFIDSGLIDKLAKNLSEVSYEGLILFSGFVEPLLDKNIATHVSTFKSWLPKCRVEMVTNGDPITLNNLNKLNDAGLDALLISCYDGEHQIEEITSLAKKSNMDLSNLVFRKRWFSEDENFGISLSNRGGLMESAEFSIANLDVALEKPCNYPAHTFFMDYTGEVLMCAHDWGKKAIVGNMKENTFLEIWTGRKFSALRKSLLKGNRKFSPCDVCNVDGTRMGNEHAAAWNSFSTGKK